MSSNINIKLIFSATASAISIIAYYPYIKDIFLKKTKPHVYTWLIWAITTATATFGVLQGNGGVGIIGIGMMLILDVIIMLLSIKYGTKNITRGDLVVLILALGAIVIWWQLGNPALAVIVATMIDFFGYIPTYRKSWQAPSEETLSFWIAMTVAYTLILLSVTNYNLLTSFYTGVIVVANIILVAILFFRRRIDMKHT